jgi:hypothetical protein
MLAIVTVMAIVFLAISRRERTSVKMAEDMATANMMAEAALERAKAEAVARMSIAGSKLHYDLFNSTNFVSRFYTRQPNGSAPDTRNVSYNDENGNLITGRDYLQMLGNLQYDPRAPVFVETNQNGDRDFRFFLDFNRNRFFETNGLVPVLDRTGNPIKDANGDIVTNNLVGDPEWIGILERSDLPHSESNRFVGRMAYMVLPAGKTLDLNFIHNQADRAGADVIDVASTQNGFARNQGVGSWEINLAAFLRELNTNAYAWNPGTYRFRLPNGALPDGFSFDDARAILAFRYSGNRRFLEGATVNYGPGNPFNRTNANFSIDRIDNYSDGPYVAVGNPVFVPLSAQLDNDLPGLPWPGSLSTNGFTDLQQIFGMGRYSPGFTNRLQRAMRTPSTYDRYTFYRLASQLGADSTPSIQGKLHLNYDNSVGHITNTVQRWTNAVRFFTNATDLMLKASIDRVVTNITGSGAFRRTNVLYQIGDTFVRTNFSITNIQVYTPPTPAQPFATGNEYTPTIHRILQVALNIYDNTTNNGARYPYYPTVLRPLYARTPTNLMIYGFEEITTKAAQALTQSWRDPQEFFSANGPGIYTNINFYGQHMVIGAKKGHPNFNELALQSYVEVSRKLEVLKNTAGGTVNDTNQMFLVSVMNRWGLEAWHSYTSSYPRNVTVAGEVVSRIVIRDVGTNATPIVFATQTRSLNVTNFNNWPARKIEVLFDRSSLLLRDVGYDSINRFTETNRVQFSNLEASPRFQLVTTNDVRFWILENDRIIDFVSFDNLTTVMDLSTNLYAMPSAVNQQFGGAGTFNDNMFWDPTPISPGSLVTVGITNQMAVSAGDIEVDNDTWRAYRFNSDDKRGGIARFRSFLGLGMRPTDPIVQPSLEKAHQTPFVPTRRMHQLITWSANDPLVHYMPEDLTRRPNSDKPTNLRIEEPLPEWNIGRINDGIYRPWAMPSDQDPTAYKMSLKDPGIRQSDDWEFPILDSPNNTFYYPNLGALGRVHRGTPWQTVYLKSVIQVAPTNQILFDLDPNVWKSWAGSIGGYPMNDWRLLDVFTTAPNENAARGLLSVNQTNRAAWSAVLSGITVATNTVRTATLNGLGFNEGVNPTNSFMARAIEPASSQISNIVESINLARRYQFEVVTNANRAANPRAEWLIVQKTNFNSMGPLTVFQSVGDVLSAPQLTIQSPFLNNAGLQVRHVWNDRTVEFIPQQILSLLQRDEPRFVVYAFGQSLKPAPRSVSTSADFYNLVTNYEITGEVITKTTFRVEGELRNPADPLRTVVESYQILPPPE